jgi:uncharacterized protein with PQ loop repeat
VAGSAIRKLGWAATAGSIVMYFSFLDQIALNLQGHKGSVILPAATAVCCSLWLLYGWLQPQRDWPIVVANLPGVVLGSTSFVTAL